MAKYGTKQYWKNELHKDTIKLDMLCNGFAKIFSEQSSLAIEDVQDMIDQLWTTSNNVQMDKSKYEEAEEEDDESQQ